MAVFELNSTHPYLPKRIAALREATVPGAAPVIARNLAAYPLAPMFGVAAGGAASAPLMVVAIVAGMAAIAIPSFKQYVQQAKTQGTPTLKAPPAPAPAATFGSDVVTGERFAWKLKLPSAKWEIVPSQQARQQNELADRWLTRADLDAHVLVIGENLGGQPLALEQFAKAVLTNAKKMTSRFRVVRESPMGTGRLIEAHTVVNRLQLVQFFGLFIHSGTAYQVHAFAPEASYPKVKDELMAAIASFEPVAD
jgi:hypothetical protein